MVVGKVAINNIYKLITVIIILGACSDHTIRSQS